MPENPYESPEAEGIKSLSTVVRSRHWVLTMLGATALPSVGGCAVCTVAGFALLNNLSSRSARFGDEVVVRCGNEMMEAALMIGLLVGAVIAPFVAYKFSR